MPRFSLVQYARELFRGVRKTSTIRRTKSRALISRHQGDVQTVAAEVLESRALLSAVPGPSGLVAWWSGNNTGSDVTGNNNGVLYGTAFAPGEVGQALSFDGKDDRLAVPNNSDLALTSSFSIEGWVNVTAYPSASTGAGMIFFRGDDRSGLDPIVLGVNPSGQLGFGIDSGNGTASVTTPIAMNQWVYVAATLDASTGLMSLYLNGTLATQITTPFTPFGALDPTQDPGVGIGNSNGPPSDPFNYPFDGLIDDLSVYNVALTQSQIQGIFNAGASGKIEPAVATGVTSVVASGTQIVGGTGDVGIGHAVTLTVSFNNAVTVDTTGGTPTLSLNDGGTATYSGGSGTTALTFLYTVAAGQNIDDLTVAGMNLNGDTIKNGSTNANLNNADTNPLGLLQVDTIRPSVLSNNRNTFVNAGTSSVSFTVTFSQPVSGVGPDDFRTATTGTVADTSIQVTPVSELVYTVTVSGITGSGTLGLNLVNNGSIFDAAGNSLGPTGLFQPAVTFAVGNNPSWIASADLNGDGFQDLVVTNSGDNTISVLLGNGDGTFKTPQTYATSASPTSVAIADLTGNGKLDLVVADNHAVDVYLGNGDGTFQPDQSFAIGFTVSSVKIADVSGDGKPDLVLTYGTGYGNDFVGVLLGNGNGTFQSGQTYATGVFSNRINPSGVGGSAVSVAIADLTGNGKMDLVVADGGSEDPNFGNSVPAQISVLMGNGDGTFQSEQTYSLGSDANSPNSVAVADLNGDGKPDVVVSSSAVYNGGSNSLTVLLNNGSGGFPTATSYGVGTTPTSVTLADMNQDGKLDLIDANAGDGTVSVLFGNGNGTFQGNQGFNVGGGDSSLTVAAFTSDGAPDIALQNGSLLLNDITGNFTGQIYTIVPPSQVYAVTPAGKETQVNTYTTDTQSRPVVAMDSAGDYVAVWQSSGEDGSSWGIYGQLYHANGTPNGNQFQVNVTTGGPQDLPAVAMDPSGDFVVTWQSQPTGTPDGYDVYARQFNASGVAQGNEFLVNQFLTANQWRPAVAMDQAGDFVITWVSYSQYMASDVSTYARRYNAAGVAQGNEFHVATSGDVFPSIGMDAAGNFVIDYGSQAERFNSSGTALGAVDTSSVAANGTVAMDASGDFVIVADRVYGSYHGQYRYVAQRYDANGDVQGSLILGPIAGQGINQIFYRVAMDNAGDFVVTYESYGDDGGADGVFAQPRGARAACSRSKRPGGGDMISQRVSSLTVVLGAWRCDFIGALLNRPSRPKTSALAVFTYVIALVGKYLCFATLALAVDLVWGFGGILPFLGHAAFLRPRWLRDGHVSDAANRHPRGLRQSRALPDFMVFFGWKARCRGDWHGFEWFPFAALMVVLVPGVATALVFGWLTFRSRVTGVYLSIMTQALTYALLLAFFRNDMGFGGNNGMTDFKDILGFNVQADGTRAALLVLSAVFLCVRVSRRAVRGNVTFRQDPHRRPRHRIAHAVPRLPAGVSYKLRRLGPVRVSWPVSAARFTSRRSASSTRSEFCPRQLDRRR